jgi:DNA-nicking Smr family endonuclease|tara:strand:- start:182 stop:604 length:423 start_codon:yes stop_codon:yes gene_type:complete
LNKKPTSEDLKAWKNFTSSKETIENKDRYLDRKKTSIQKIRKIDLHGLSLDEANNKIEILIDKYIVEGVEKIIIITGKGLRSKAIDSPYVSKDLSILKNSVPDYINNNSKIKNKIKSMSKAKIKDGGEGAFYIFLKKFRE